MSTPNTITSMPAYTTSWTSTTLQYGGFPLPDSLTDSLKPLWSGDSPEPIAQEVKDFLGGLGSVHRIREELRTLGIAGRRGASNDCAIARLLRQRYPELSLVCVGPYAIRLDTDTASVMIRTPHAVSLFIRMFDGGVFPDLAEDLAEVGPMPNFIKEAFSHAYPDPGALCESVSNL